MNYFVLSWFFFFLQLGCQGTRASWQEPWQPRAAGSAQLNLIQGWGRPQVGPKCQEVNSNQGSVCK